MRNRSAGVAEAKAHRDLLQGLTNLGFDSRLIVSLIIPSQPQVAETLVRH